MISSFKNTTYFHILLYEACQYDIGKADSSFEDISKIKYFIFGRVIEY